MTPRAAGSGIAKSKEVFRTAERACAENVAQALAVLAVEPEDRL